LRTAHATGFIAESGGFMRNPASVSGRIWVQQHFQALGRFLASSRTDEAALRDAARALEYLLQRDPDYARETRQLALHFAMSSWNAGWPDIVESAVRTGLDADVMAPDLRDLPAPAGLLLLSLAECHLLQGQRIEGQETLNEALERLGSGSSADIVAEATRARALLLRGELDEIDRETERAHIAFEAALTANEPLICDGAGRARLAREWTLQVFGPEDTTIASQLTGLRAFGLQQFEETSVRALLGLLRTSARHSAAELLALCEKTRAAVAEHGLTRAVYPFAFVPMMARLDPDDARSFGSVLREAADRARETVLAAGLPDGVAPDLAAQVQRLAPREPDDERTAHVWELAIALGVAGAVEARGELERANVAYHDALRLSFNTGLAVPRALVAGALAAFLVRHGREPEHIRDMVDLFLTTFEAARSADAQAFADLRYRALFDDAIAAITTWELEAAAAMSSAESRRRISVLLDLLRTRDIPPVLLIGDRSVVTSTATALVDGLETITNTLDRITEADRDPGLLVLIVHNGRGGQRTFIAIHDEVSVHRADPSLTTALLALEEVAERAAHGRGHAGENAPDPVEVAARQAYDALPAAVRDALAKTQAIFVSQDYREAAIPFELLHDGEHYLLQTHVIAQFTSLRHLARTLDSPPVPRTAQRALVAPVPLADPHHPLVTVPAECDAIVDLLSADDLDVPRIEERRLDARFFTDRLRFADILHIAAHGRSAAGTEYVLLPEEQRLSVDDLLARKHPSLPFVYLNTCRLGKAVYAGGGRARGVAYTLAELGAPAVLANTTDVLDQVSSDTAMAFYEAAQDAPVGWALLATRRKLIEAGTHPALIGRVVLFGDPWTSIGQLADSTIVRDPARELLDDCFDGNEAEIRSAAASYLAKRLTAVGADRRFEAATALIRGVNEATGDERKQGGPGSGPASFDLAVTLADELRHLPAQAMLRVLRARSADPEGAPNVEQLRDAIFYLEPLASRRDFWTRLLVGVRGDVRRADLTNKGLEIRRRGPGSDEPDPAMEAVLSALFASEHAAEDVQGAATRRLHERSIEDIAWNAVVAGHPNRFHDTIEASAYCRLVVRKLIDRGHLSADAEPVVHPMLTGLMWFLWSSQNTTFLDRALAEGQAGTVLAMLKDVAKGWPPAVDAPWVGAVLRFPQRLDEVLQHLEKQPWERHAKEVADRIPRLAEDAKTLLETVSAAAPEALAGCAAFLAGLLAVRNTYTALECQDDLEEHMKRALWTVNADNEARFSKYLWEGFAVVRNRQPDELERWWLHSLSAARNGQDEVPDDGRDLEALAKLETAGAQTAADYVERGAVFASASLFGRAIEDLDQAIQLDPDHTTAFAERAIVHASVGDRTRAEGDVERALALGFSPALREGVDKLLAQSDAGDPAELVRLRMNDATYKQRQQDWAGAIAAFERVLELDATSSGAFAGRGNSLLALGRYEAAFEDLDAAVRHDSTNGRAWLGRALARVQLGQAEEAQCDVENAIANGVDRDKVTAALRSARPATLPAGPSNPEAQRHCARADRFVANEQYDEALAAYDEAVDAEPGCAPLYAGRAAAHLLAGHAGKAIEDYSEALRLHPRAEMHASRAVARTLVGDDAGAERDIEDAVQLGMPRAEAECIVVDIRSRRRS
jgi:tetratricopeptide (TPR) repeat protein